MNGTYNHTSDTFQLTSLTTGDTMQIAFRVTTREEIYAFIRAEYAQVDEDQARAIEEACDYLAYASNDPQDDSRGHAALSWLEYKLDDAA